MIAFILRWWWWFTGKEAVRLNLHIDWREWARRDPVEYLRFLKRRHMAKIGDSFTAKIAPTNAAGAPAPVFNVMWLETGDSYDISVAPDGLTAILTAKASGAANSVTVQATTRSGATLTATVNLADVEAPPVDEEAVALNLTVA